MISRLEIENFQSHKNTILNFNSGLNVIVGESDYGKTAIVRSLRWIAKNRPTGDGFRSDWGGNTKVTLSLSEGNEIVRKKTDSLNEYQLNETKMQSFGSGVPDEVTSILNISDVNLQTQFESHYLISRSPGEVAQHFNKVAGLDRIDASLKNIKSWIGQINSKIKHKKEYRDDLEKDLNDNYSHVEEVDSQLSKLENLNETIENSKEEINELQSFIEEARELEAKIDGYAHLLEAEKEVNNLLELSESVDKKEEEIDYFDQLLDDAAAYQKEIDRLEKLTGAESEVNNLLEKYQDYENLENKVENLNDLIHKAKKYSKLERQNKNRVETLEEKLHSNMEGFCPFCGQRINSEDYYE